MTHVFVSYVRENKETVDKLVTELRRHGIKVWLDRDEILPGQRWQQGIRTAIQEGAFFLACFSKEYAARTRTYLNEELTIAIQVLRTRPVDRSWLIPIKFSDCSVPARDIGGGETLLDLQWVDLYSGWESGVGRLLAVIQRGDERPSSTPVAPSSSPNEGAQALPVPRECPLSSHIGDTLASADRLTESVQASKGVPGEEIAERDKAVTDVYDEGARELGDEQSQTTRTASIERQQTVSAAAPRRRSARVGGGPAVEQASAQFADEQRTRDRGGRSQGQPAQHRRPEKRHYLRNEQHDEEEREPATDRGGRRISFIGTHGNAAVVLFLSITISLTSNYLAARLVDVALNRLLSYLLNSNFVLSELLFRLIVGVMALINASCGYVFWREEEGSNSLLDGLLVFIFEGPLPRFLYFLFIFCFSGELLS